MVKVYEQPREEQRPETPSFAKPIPLLQNESVKRYRKEKKEHFDLYEEFWRERKKAEAAWFEKKPHDSYWLDINPDELTEEDFFYYKLLESGRVEKKEVGGVLKNEYWPRIEHHLNEASAGAKERARRLGQSFNLQDFHTHNSRFNFYNWLSKKFGIHEKGTPESAKK